MLLTLERPDHDYYLRGADGQVALVNDRRLTQSFVLTPDALLEDWAVNDARTLSVEQLQPLLALSPEVILLGSGANQMFPPPATMAACLDEVLASASATSMAEFGPARPSSVRPL